MELDYYVDGVKQKVWCPVCGSSDFTPYRKFPFWSFCNNCKTYIHILYRQDGLLMFICSKEILAHVGEKK